MRLAVYGGVSISLAMGVVLSALYQNSNFYAACVCLSKSSSSIMILLNVGLLFSIFMGKTLQSIFFGQLRAIEVEHLYERSWYAITETCLAMTIFREEFNLQFVLVFTTLLFLKIFHWLCQDRIEFMEQSPSHRVTFHVRIVSLMSLLLLIDVALALHAINGTITKGPNMMIMFGFEYTILICIMMSIIGKYVLNIIDMRSEEPWEGKSIFVFYLDLITDFFKLVTYIVFFVFLCFYYQLPLHIIRDVYVTFRSFVQKCRDLYRYRRATRNMDELYPDASADDLSRTSDSTCIICREEMHAVVVPEGGNREEPRDTHRNTDQPKKLPCGHIFHFYCLRSWLERQQSCPTCRRSVLSETTQAQAQAQPQAQAQAQAQPQAQAQAQPQAQAVEPEQAQQQQQQQQQPMPNQMPNQMPVPTLTPNFTQAPPPDHAYAQEQPSAWGGINSSYSSFHSQNNSLPQSLHESSYPPQYSQPNGSYGRAPLSTHFSTAPTILSDIPGLIPLIPMTQENSNPLFGATHQGTAQMDYQHISDEDLLTLSETTRESMMQRLVLLERTQSQIFHSMQILAQALSVIPTTGLPQWNDGNKTETSTSQTYSTQSTSSLGETTVKTVADPHVESVNESLLDTSSSSKQKGKMIDNSTPLNE